MNRCILALVLAGLFLANAVFGEEYEFTAIKTNYISWSNAVLNTYYTTLENREKMDSGKWVSFRYLVYTDITYKLFTPYPETSAYFRIVNSYPTNIPDGMCFVPGGTFQMGDQYGIDADEIPMHEVYVSPFFIDQFEVSNQKLCEVFQWANTNRRLIYYEDVITNVAGGITNITFEMQIQNTTNGGDIAHLLVMDENKWCGIHYDTNTSNIVVREGFSNLPAVKITWFGALAYCNYKSEMEGLTRCIIFTNWECNFSNNGYRLPTEAEWEKAARGGWKGYFYPWESYGASYLNYTGYINGSCANYYNSGDPYESNFPYSTPVGYYNGSQIPTGSNMANPYGLYDMAGNVREWCWDWYEDDWYGVTSASYDDTPGPGWYWPGVKVIRGGDWGK